MIEIALFALIVGLDQFTKYMTDVHLMPLGTSVPVIEDVFHFTSAHNTGAAFSILRENTWLLTIASLLASVFIAYLLIVKRKRLFPFTRICLALILGGAVGNLIDRVAFQYVRDMLEFRFIQFAVFNVADCGITAGTILLAIDILFLKGKTYFDEPKEQT